MSTISTIDLSSLPAPGVIEELDFEVILRAMRDDLVARFPPIAPVIDLQSEPARKSAVSACRANETSEGTEERIAKRASEGAAISPRGAVHLRHHS